MKQPLPTRPACNRDRRRLVLALAGSGTLAACGGGGGVDGGVDALPLDERKSPLGVGAGGTGMGAVTMISAQVATAGAGVIDLAGVRLQADAAVLADGDGQALALDQIAAGMTARALAGPIMNDGGVSVAQASSLVVDTQLRGPARPLDARTLVLLDQRVSIDARTVYAAGLDPAALPTDLRVWGQLDLAGGRVVASRIAAADASDTPMLRGLLLALDRASGLVHVGGLWARAADPSRLPDGLAPGAVARLVLGGRTADGVWDLRAVRDDALRPPEGAKARLQGRVTQFSNLLRFTVDGVPVDAAGASIEGASALAAGAAVEVSGTVRGGVLQARTVHAEAGEPVEFEGRITAVDMPTQRLVVGGRWLYWSVGTVFLRGTARDLLVGRRVAGLATWSPTVDGLRVERLQFDR